MAKLQYFAAIPDESLFDTAFAMDIHSSTSAAFIPVVAGDDVTVTFGGTGFLYDNAGDFTGGTVKSLTFASGSDDVLKLTGLSLSAADALAIVETSPLQLLMDELEGADRVVGSDDADTLTGLAGADIMNGKGGNDTIDGGSGQNILIGGKGADTFVCADSDGDTIIDFDARGGLGKQDLIDINGADFTRVRSGTNTAVLFDGGSILLMGIKPNQIDSSDFTEM